MFGSRTLSICGQYIWTSGFLKDMHIFRAPGRWHRQTQKLTEHLPWGRFKNAEVCTEGILFYQFTTFLYLAESGEWVQ